MSWNALLPSSRRQRFALNCELDRSRGDTATKSGGNAMGISDDAIRERAYLIWEREGRPHGRDFEHWVRAQVELIAETTSAATASPSPPSGNAAPSRPRPSSSRSAAPPKPSRSVSSRNSRAKKPA